MTIDYGEKEPAESNFYSHAREGRDGNTGIVLGSRVDFYSHAREGRDVSEPVRRDRKTISTHTPARGVTRYVSRKNGCEPAISTHTPARGVTFGNRKMTFQLFRFLLTRPRGA